MDILRTPDECFDGLVDCPFPPRYTQVEGPRIHHLEAGPVTGPPVVMLHGDPAWSYSYRKVLPMVGEAGYRAMAPDLVGFGRSDKPANEEAYTLSGHVAWLGSWLEALDLKEATLVCQGLSTVIGLRLASRMPTRLSSIVVAGGFLPTGDRPLGAAFGAWDLLARYSPFFSFGLAVQAGCKRKLSEEEKAAYEAPFPTTGHATGARLLTRIVPRQPDEPEAWDNRRAWAVLVSWDKPFVTAFGEHDRFFKGAEEVLRHRVPGSAGQSHVRLPAGHFVQEDAPEKLARVIVETAARGRSRQ